LSSVVVGKRQIGVQNREKRLNNDYVTSFQYKPEEISCRFVKQQA